VNDGSQDATAELVSEMAKGIPFLSLLENKKNRGKGAVVRQGMLAARGEIRLFMDADNSTSLEHLELALPYLQNEHEQYDIVVASRAVRGAQLDPPQPLFRRVAGKVLNLFAQALLLPGVWDTQCGFKVFTGGAAEEIFSRAEMNGWAFDVEALALARALELRIKEIPAHWRNDRASTVPLSAGLRFAIETLTIRFRLWADTYHIRTKNSAATKPLPGREEQEAKNEI